MWEIQRGDRGAAQKRIEATAGLPLLADTKDMEALAGSLIRDGLLPEKAYLDAFHIASATICGMDYLVTWNQAHLFNLDRIGSLYAMLRTRGHIPPVLARPDYLLEAYHGS